MKLMSAWSPLFRSASGAALGVRRSCPQSLKVVEKNTPFSPLRRYASEASPARPKKRRTGLYILGGSVLAGTATVSVSDDAKHIVQAAQRSGRVVGTLFLCINEYVYRFPDGSLGRQLSDAAIDGR